MSDEREKSQLISDDASSVAWILDLKKDAFSYVSPSLKEVLGYTPEEGRTLSLKQIFIPEDYRYFMERLPARLKAFSAGDESARMMIHELNHVRKDGSDFRAEILTVLMEGADKRGPRMLGVSRDLTHSDWAREQLEREHALLKTLIEQIPDAIYVKDEDGRFMVANPGVARLMGARHAEALLGRTDFDYYPLHQASAYRADEEALMKGRTPLINKDETRVNGKGETVHILTTKAPLLNMQGQVVGLVGVSRDISDRRQAEKAREYTEMRYRRLFQTAGDAIFIMKDDLFLDCNEMTMKMFNGRQDQIIGRHPYELSPPVQPDGRDSIEKALEKIRAALRGEPQRFEWVHRRIDGSDFDAEVTLNTLELEEGTHLLAFVRDITLRKRSERAVAAHTEQLRKTCVATVDVIAMAVESRDAYTSGHQKRVAELARWIALEMALPESQIDGIQMAGLVHDLGKISIPAEILSRPRQLSTHEYALIKVHPQTGYDILKNVEFPWPIAEIVYQHHERLDGSGYPRGLKGEEVRLEARILAVADVVEAISSHRPYRPAHSVATALDEIETHRGTLYDPAVVDACLRLFREKNFVFQTTG